MYIKLNEKYWWLQEELGTPSTIYANKCVLKYSYKIGNIVFHIITLKSGS